MIKKPSSAAQHVAQHFLWQVDANTQVATLTLHRPERKNALSFATYEELHALFGLLDVAHDIHAVIVTGAADNFCSGGDVHDIIGPLTRMAMPELLEFTRLTGALVKAMRACPQPLIAAIDGVCAGAGAMIALACDLRLGTTRSRSAFLFTRVGLTGADMGACALLPRVIGQGRAAELLYTGRTLGGEEAEHWGLFNRLCPPETLLAEARHLATELASGPRFAHRMTKRMLHREWNMSLDDAIDAEADAQAICMQTEDFRRAYQAFVAREKPRFEGN
ncbi:MAG: enoyl-CoA hydratase family protein [Sterolibacterium sp.]|jgi:enoyl-CoA hydratase/carnithine racemase|nr:enoyl-CoA hydratase family protein [Sterolibacterium sp.]